MSQTKSNNPIIDTHSHILYGLDDGAKSISESVAMAKAAAEAGIGIIVATPHKLKGKPDFDIIQAQNKIDLLNKTLSDSKIPVKVLFGAENYADFELDKRFTMNNTQYLLLEFPMQSYPAFCDELVDDLLHKKIIPILSDVEFNRDMHENPEIIERLVNKGCLIQLIATSLVNKHKSVRDFSIFLLKNRVYHLIASNAHDIQDYRDFPRSLDIAGRYLDEDELDEMIYGLPKKIISGERYTPPHLEFKEKFHTPFGLRAFAKRFLPFI